MNLGIVHDFAESSRRSDRRVRARTNVPCGSTFWAGEFEAAVTEEHTSHPSPNYAIFAMPLAVTLLRAFEGTQ